MHARACVRSPCGYTSAAPAYTYEVVYRVLELGAIQEEDQSRIQAHMAAGQV